jgi:hypothetical protein
MAKSVDELKADASATAAVKDEKPKLSKEELKAQRLKNLKPKTKSPEKAAEDNRIKEHIKNLLTKNPAGMTARAMRAEIFTGTDETEFAGQEKRIRFIARDMKCTRTPIENSRQKVYKLPA